MKKLRELLGCFRHKTKGEQALRLMFSSMPRGLQAIHLEEIGLPNGKATTIQWLSSEESTKSRICVRAILSKEMVWQTLTRSKLEFTELLKTIRELDSECVENKASMIRDGVVYFVAWGDENNVRSLTLRNPSSWSKQQLLVSAIVSSAKPHDVKTAGQ